MLYWGTFFWRSGADDINKAIDAKQSVDLDVQFVNDCAKGPLLNYNSKLRSFIFKMKKLVSYFASYPGLSGKRSGVIGTQKY